MTNAFASLRPGDKLQLPDGKYVASGRMTLRTPDGSVWSEWLLAPVGMAPASAIANRVHRWLVFEDETGLTLWSAAEVPTSMTPAALSGNSFELAGRKYLVRERDTMQVVDITGDVGGDASLNEKFEFVDLSSGLGLMTVEWNDRGLDVSTGRRIGAHDLVNWARTGGNDLIARLPAGSRSVPVSPRRSTDSESAASVGTWVIGGLLAFIMIALEECSGPDEDCRQQLNPNTHQMEIVCRDGVRSRTGRLFGGWGGK